MKNLRILIKYLRKFLASIICIVPFTKINLVNYPFSKEFKALNQDFISVGNDFRSATDKYNKKKQNEK